MTMRAEPRIEAEEKKLASLSKGWPETRREVAAEIVTALKTTGFAYLTPFSIENHALVASDIGTIISRSDVKVDKERAALQEKTRVMKGRPGPYGSETVGFHTDNIRVDVMAMYCVEQDAEDGAILLLDTDDLARCFSIQELAALSKLDVWAPSGAPTGKHQEDFFYVAPLLSKADEVYRVYYIPWLLRHPADEASRAMLKGFSDYVRHKEETQLIRLPVRKEESVFIDNHRMLHGRRPISENSKRHMVRHYISVPAMSCCHLIRRVEPESAGQTSP